MHGMLTIAAGAWQSLAGVAFGALLVAIALHLAKLLAEARAWHWIVKHAHGTSDLSFRTTGAAFIGSIGANAVLPARVGEAFRVGVVRRRLPGSSVVTIVATVVLETGLEVAFGAAVIVFVLLGRSSFGKGGASGAALHGFFAQPVVLAVLACVAVVAVVFGLVFRDRARTLLSLMADGFSIVRSPRVFVTHVLSWKLLAWTLRLGSVYAFLLAFHVPAAPWTTLVVVAAQNIAASIPLLPGNAGTQQAAIGIALAGSASAASLIGFGVGMQATTAIADVAIGIVAVALVANRSDLARACASLRPRRSARTAGAQA